MQVLPEERNIKAERAGQITHLAPFLLYFTFRLAFFSKFPPKERLRTCNGSFWICEELVGLFPWLDKPSCLTLV